MFIFFKYVIINPMKILFVTDLYPIDTGETTTPKTLHNFVIEWIKSGHQVEVIKPNFMFNSFLRGKPFYQNGFYEYEGIRIFNVNYFTPFLFDVAAKIPESLNVSDYDVIVAHMPSGIIFANKLAEKYNKPLVCGVHTSDIEVLTNPIYSIYFKSQLKQAYNNAKKIACRSFVLQKKFNKILPEFATKTFVAPSGIKEVEKARRQEGKFKMETQFVNNNSQTKPSLLPSCPPVLNIITCANFIKRKNIDKLILAVRDIENVELKIIGGGKEQKALKSLARQQKIEFLGRLSNDKVLQEMQKADVFILPSVNETFGMVYLEAMAAGCITVCTKGDGVDGIIIDSENGFLTELTVEGLKETILRIKSCQNIDQIRQNSLDTIKNFTQESCAKNYIDNLY